MKPVSGAPDKDEGDFEYALERTSENDKSWKELLGRPQFGDEFFLRKIKVSVGIDGSYAEHTDASNFALIRIDKTWFYGCLIGLVAYLILLFSLANSTKILKDSSYDLCALGLKRGDNPPWSLGKVQMAFWFSLTLASFLFIWLITGNYDIITPGILGLIGISATTALGAVAIGDSKIQKSIDEILLLIKQEQVIVTLIATLPADSPDLPTKRTEQSALETAIKTKKNELNPDSISFRDDLLADANGISFHRLQMVIWTLVLGLIFLDSAWTSLIMPEFSGTLLALQGITAGTYLGFKFPEKQS